MSYRLKKGQESFQVVDGKFAGRRYERGREYDEIPPEESRRFEKIPIPRDNKKQSLKIVN